MKKYVNMKYLFCALAVSILMAPAVNSQCNRQLVDRAAQMAGHEAIFIRDFKVKLTEGTMDNPSPMGRFPVYLNEGAHYRFTLASDNEAESFAILQLMKKDNVYGSTYDFSSGDNNGKFDFTCDNSGTYQILISFDESRPGCAAGVLSLVLEDSMKVIEPGVPTVSDSAGVLYLYVANELQIAATGIPGGRLDVSIDNGTIDQQGKDYLARPEKPGQATIYVHAYKQNGKLSESDSLTYVVDYPPFPQLVLPGMTGNVLYKSRLRGEKEIELNSYYVNHSDIYTLIAFTLASDHAGMNAIAGSGMSLTQNQLDLIRSIPAGGRLYINNMQFTDPEGKRHLGNSQVIWIEE